MNRAIVHEYTISTHNSQKMFVCMFDFYGISTVVYYLMPNPFLYK